MNSERFEQVLSKVCSYSDESKAIFLENILKKNDFDMLSRALVYELLGKILIKLKRPYGEIFEKAGSLLEDYWTMNHISGVIKNSKQRKILSRAMNNYLIAKDFYKSRELRISEARAQRRVLDIRSQIRSYPTIGKKVVLFFVIFSFLASISLFSNNITGFSIASNDEEQSILIGGILFFTAIIGAIYIIFFYILYRNGENI